jgi:hypothetical protein
MWKARKFQEDLIYLCFIYYITLHLFLYKFYIISGIQFSKQTIKYTISLWWEALLAKIQEMCIIDSKRNLLPHTNVTHQQNNSNLKAKHLSSIPPTAEEHFGELILRLFIYIKILLIQNLNNVLLPDSLSFETYFMEIIIDTLSIAKLMNCRLTPKNIEEYQ